MRKLVFLLVASSAFGALRSDFNNDGIVDELDLKIFKSEWKQEDPNMAWQYTRYDGTGKISFVNDAALNPGTGDISISFWAKDIFTQSSMIMYKSMGVGYRIQYQYTTEQLICTIEDGADSSSNYAHVDANTSEWTHVCFVADRDTWAYIYINGALVTTGGLVNSTGSIDNTENLVVGGDTGTFLNGCIDDIVIAKRAFTEEEILELYNEGIGLFLSDDTFHDKDAVYITFNSDFDSNLVYGRSVISGVGSNIVGSITGGVTQAEGGVPFHAIALDPDKFQTKKVYANKTFKKIQYRFRNAGGQFQLRSFTLKDPQILNNR